MNWFDVDKAGLAAILERRGKSFAVFELVQNAWDSGAKNVDITLEPIAGSPYATLIVKDDSPEGWTDLEHAYKMFAESRRASDPNKRGRFNLGEKLVLSVCRSASIATMEGTIIFDDKGRRTSKANTEVGTIFSAEIRMTRDELADVLCATEELIPPVATKINGKLIVAPKPIHTFEYRLPTEFMVEGQMRKSVRLTYIAAYEGEGQILEMGVPVCEADMPWRLNVMQKVPLTFERDNVTGSFRKTLQVAALNEMATALSPEQSTASWVSDAIGDERVQPSALGTVIKQRFGDRAVVASPNDPVANAQAEHNGFNVIHGGAFSGEAWDNVKKNGLLLPAGKVFPTPRPMDRSDALDNCPYCKQKLPTA